MSVVGRLWSCASDKPVSFSCSIMFSPCRGSFTWSISKPLLMEFTALSIATKKFSVRPLSSRLSISVRCIAWSKASTRSLNMFKTSLNWGGFAWPSLAPSTASGWSLTTAPFVPLEPSSALFLRIRVGILCLLWFCWTGIPYWFDKGLPLIRVCLCRIRPWICSDCASRRRWLVLIWLKKWLLLLWTQFAVDQHILWWKPPLVCVLLLGNLLLLWLGIVLGPLINFVVVVFFVFCLGFEFIWIFFSRNVFIARYMVKAKGGTFHTAFLTSQWGCAFKLPYAASIQTWSNPRSCYYLLGKGGYVFGSVGLSVCLFVCLWTILLKKLWTDWDEILWTGPE